MSAPLGRNHLVRFEQGEDGARVLQAELFRPYVNWRERARIFRNVCGM